MFEINYGPYLNENKCVDKHLSVLAHVHQNPRTPEY